MTKLRSSYRMLAAVSAIAMAIVFGWSVSGLDGANGDNGLVTNLEGIFPRVKVIDFADAVARFDTSTGEISRFSGRLTGRSAGGTFISFVRPVAQQTSGFLQIQEASGAIFLVDVINGDTWILRHRGNIASWQRVNLR